jgi:hypothetical protein
VLKKVGCGCYDVRVPRYVSCLATRPNTLHTGIIFDHMIRKLILGLLEKTWCARVMLAVSEHDVSTARMLLDCSRLFRTAKTWGRSPGQSASPGSRSLLKRNQFKI